MNLTLIILTLLLGDWPGFRGDGTAASPEAKLPAGFTTEAGIRWEAKLPGRGVSAPVVVGENVYVTSSSGVRDDELHVHCFDAKTGQMNWHRRLAATGSTVAHPDTCMAAPTPAADSTGVYALFACGDLVAFAPNGDLRWYRSIAADYPEVSNQVGMASSPVLAGGKLIVPMDNPGDGFLGAIDPATGQNAWKVPRPKEMNWTTPVVRNASDGATEVVVLGQAALTAYDAADGKKRWAAKAGGSISSPSLAGDGAILAPGSGTTLIDVSSREPKQVWSSPKLQTGMSSPAVAGERVYGVTRAGFAVCADLKTGKLLWQERVKGKFSASPVVGDGKLYLFSEEGDLVTLKLGDKPELLAESHLEGRGQATPAIANGALYLRVDGRIICVAAK